MSWFSISPKLYVLSISCSDLGRSLHVNQYFTAIGLDENGRALNVLGHELFVPGYFQPTAVTMQLTLKSTQDTNNTTKMGFRKTVKKLFSFAVPSSKTLVAHPSPEQPKNLKGTKAKEPTPNEQVVAEFVRYIVEHRNFGCLFDDRVDILFKEAPMTLGGFLEEWEKIFKSFPDFSMSVEGGINEQADGKVVAVFVVGGTHTGAPYCFGPFPEIETTNIKVKNDPERCTFTIKDGKITKFRIEPVGGELTGPPGLYTQIGGLIF